MRVRLLGGDLLRLQVLSKRAGAEVEKDHLISCISGRIGIRLRFPGVYVGIDRRPENLLLADTASLLGFARCAWNDVQFRGVVLAELVTRWYLSGDEALERSLVEILGEEFWRHFLDWKEAKLGFAELGGLCNPSGLPGFVRELRARMKRLFLADGFIPVFNCVGEWFIPFELVKDDEVKGAVWGDRENTPVEGWHEDATRALAGTGFTGVRLQVRKGKEFEDSETHETLVGNSLMLPIRLAAWRKDKASFPQYDLLRVVATGAFDEDMCLADVDTRRKVDAVERLFRGAVLFGPKVPGWESFSPKCFIGLDCGTEEGALRERMRDALEATNDPTLVEMPADYVLKRQEIMFERVDHDNYNRWGELARQLETLRSAIRKERYPECWLGFMNMLATAYCHAGNTEESQRVVNEALGFARENGHEGCALRLQLTAMVNAQDSGYVTDFEVFAHDLGEALERYNGPEHDDLLMRYHGTLGQMHAWGAVYGIVGYSRQEAERNVSMALKYAITIANGADAERKMEAESNVAQDLNYCHLMKALFAPGTTEEDRAYDEARQQLVNLGDKGSRTRINNEFHQKRQRSEAFFNAWRNGGVVPSKVERKAVQLPDFAEEWQVAANRRHLGALAAANGEGREATTCFDEGERTLPLKRCWGPVIGAIRLVLLVQASRSLSACDCVAKSDHFAALAQETYDRFAGCELFKLIHAEAWMDALKQGVAPSGLPAFYY